MKMRSTKGSHRLDDAKVSDPSNETIPDCAVAPAGNAGMLDGIFDDDDEF